MVKQVLATFLVFAAGCGVSKDEFAAQQRDAQQNLKNYQEERDKAAALEKNIADLQAQTAVLQSQLGELTATSAKLQQEKGLLEAKSAQYQQLTMGKSAPGITCWVMPYVKRLSATCPTKNRPTPDHTARQ